MKPAFMMVILLVLSGCGTYADSWGGPYSYLTDSGQTHSESRSPANAHCEAVARQRSLDAKANDYSIELEDKIYKLTYQECVHWDAEHRQ